jgi:mannose-6-phosphate isomerase-like protein (cupin superfamily)
VVFWQFNTGEKSMSNSDKAVVPIVKLAMDNDAFRDEVITGKECQVVLMTIPAGEEIGSEVHDDHDQILVFVGGNGRAVLDGVATDVGVNDLVFVHAGVEHNFINTGIEPLRLYTIYAPPEHQAGTRHDTKAEADEAEQH